MLDAEPDLDPVQQYSVGPDVKPGRRAFAGFLPFLHFRVFVYKPVSAMRTGSLHFANFLCLVLAFLLCVSPKRGRAVW